MTNKEWAQELRKGLKEMNEKYERIKERMKGIRRSLS